MERVVALLRSVNVGGNRMKMDFLRGVARDAGCRDVATIVATGNVVMARPDDLQVMRTRLQDLIAQRYGELAVVMRTHDELVDAVAGNPWAPAVAAGHLPARQVHTMFLVDSPDDGAVQRAIDEQPGGPEEFVVVGRDVHVRYPEDQARTKLTSAWLERRLGTGTMRNHNTVQRVLAATAPDPPA